MALKQPQSTNECIYFTRRTLEPRGRIMAWTFKAECPKCKKEMMGKPVEKGKVKIRAKEYVCPSCNFTETKEVHEAKLTCSIEYECCYCGKAGETTAPYKRKSFEGVPAIIFSCESCGKKIGITKKMKAGKKKKNEPDDDF